MRLDRRHRDHRPALHHFGHGRKHLRGLVAGAGAVALFWGAPAYTQVVTSPPYSDAQAVGAVQAAGLIPPPCAAPMADTLSGSAGSTPCTATQEATRPTSVQRAIVTTDGNGNWALTWAKSFPVQPALSLKPIMGLPSRGDCGVATDTPQGATGSCWTYQSVVVSAVGSTVSPISTAAAGVQVMIVGGAPTQ